MEILYGEGVGRQRHWHLYADQTPPRAEISYDRAPDAVAMTPEHALAWMAAQADRHAERIPSHQQANARRLTEDARLREVHLAALSWGRSTGAIINLGPDTALRLYAHSVGPSDSKACLPSLLPAVCDQQHA
ncbi:MAG: hypothetical protein ACRD0K_12855 [Egibacteraceae bacterium]